MENKKRLAKLIVSEFHGEKGAEKGQKHFESVIQGKGEPDDIETIPVHAKTTTEAVAELFSVSKSEARRLIEQGGITLDDEVVHDALAKPKEGVYKKGKRHFKRLKNT